MAPVAPGNKNSHFATSWRIPFDFLGPRKLQATARSDASKIEWMISITETIDSPTRWAALPVGCFFEERASQKSLDSPEE